MMAAAALFITSCASDDMTSSQTGEKAEVTFALGLEDGIGTRAISDGTGANYLAYAVFNADGTILEDYKKQGEAVTFPVQKTLTLAKDKTYKIVFWAQNSACTAYTVSDDMKVTVDYAGINNDEARDAFFKTVEFTVNGAAQIDVELQRALAQINVGVTAADWEAAKKSGVTIEKSVAYIKQAATSVDLLTGKASDPVNVTYTENAIPAEDLVVDGKTYKWLSMSYILVADGTETGAEKATLNDLGFSFNYTGGAVEFKSGLTSVPVQRNYRTNIVGKLLTGDVNFNITVDNIYAGNHAYPETIEQQLAMAAAVGGAVTLTEDVTLTKPLVVNSDMIINLNGNTITGTWAKSEGAVITVNAGATLNISGGTVKSAGENGGSAIQNNGVAIVNGVTLNGAPNANGSWPSYAVNNTGTMTITDSEITSYHGGVASYKTGAVVTMNNTNIDMTGIPGFTSHGIYTYDDGAVIVNGGNIANNATDQNATGASVINGAVTVNSGTFTGRIENYYGTPVLKGGSYSVEPKVNFIAAGYKVVKNGDKYYVVAENVSAVASTQDEINAAVAAGGTVVVAAGEYTFPGSSIKEGTTLDCEEGTVFKGKSSLDIKGATVEGATFDNPGGTVVGGTVNGTFKGCKFTGGNALRYASAGETVVFEDCEFSGDLYGVHFDNGNNDVIFRNCVLSGFNALGAALTMATFDGCTFKGNGKSDYNGANLWGSTKMINCEFTFDGSTTYEWVDCIGLDKTYEFENCTINGVPYTKDNYNIAPNKDLIGSSKNHPSVKINGETFAFNF